MLQPLVLAGETYRVMRLDLSARGPRFLLRDGHGRLYGVYALGADCSLRTDLLGRDLENPNPLAGIELVDGGGRLVARPSGRRR